jgi:hypothetical protein
MVSAHLDLCFRHWLGRGFPLSSDLAFALAKLRTSPPILRGLGSDWRVPPRAESK